eukprot:CAMPEP_0173270602 /NCGR_PEP_ID=MMETSP1143-20121109/337_1 /TAXON_ID=483371 /ORGANISM="non described non described, Strain CCMP2298" /LENGTH=178 /DNA_ID=CAMNT_0014207043 /DNA_START=141 /DNA_END=674 /DNA_ORIENTATION=-
MSRPAFSSTPWKRLHSMASSSLSRWKNSLCLCDCRCLFCVLASCTTSTTASSSSSSIEDTLLSFDSSSGGGGKTSRQIRGRHRFVSSSAISGSSNASRGTKALSLFSARPAKTSTILSGGNLVAPLILSLSPTTVSLIGALMRMWGSIPICVLVSVSSTRMVKSPWALLQPNIEAVAI